LRDTERPCQQNQDARDGAKADAGLSKEWQGDMDHVDCGSGGESAPLCLKRTPAGLRRLEGLGELIALGRDAGLLSSLVAHDLPALLGCVFPLIPAVLHCGKLAHVVSLRGNPDGPRLGGPMGPKRSLEHTMIRDEVHRSAHCRANGLRPPPIKGNT
jgi:hypothetical protein